MELTVVIACKDRQVNIAYCTASICGCVPQPNVIIVDFGSDKPIAEHVKYKNVKIIRVDRDIGTFHKARALNIGIRAVTTKFLCVTDADQIFKRDFFGVAQRELSANSQSFLMCRTHFLKVMPTDLLPAQVHKRYAQLITLCNEQGVKIRGDGNCNATSTEWFHRVHGYDEKYIGFAAEDSDLAMRASVSGLTKIWLHGKTSMIHLPHEHKGPYYAAGVVKKNVVRFRTKRAAKNIELIANPNNVWGVQ